MDHLLTHVLDRDPTTLSGLMLFTRVTLCHVHEIANCREHYGMREPHTTKQVDLFWPLAGSQIWAGMSRSHLTQEC